MTKSQQIKVGILAVIIMLLPVIACLLDTFVID